MEIEGSLRYFGGRWKFLARLRAGLPRLGFEARIAEASTARAALWMARGSDGRLEAQPVSVIDLAPEALELLAKLGVKTLGRLMNLPRDDVTQRFGQALVEQMDQASGKAPEARRFFVPPARFAARLVLPAPVTQAEHALFAARRLLDQMEGFLAARQAGVRVFFLQLLHDDQPATGIKMGLASCGRDAVHFGKLLRERLAQTRLHAAVEAIRLEAGEIEILPEKNRFFFDDPRAGGEEWLQLVERLQSRLGSDAVHGLDTRPDHRPERAWVPVPPERKFLPKEEGQRGPRPLWLLDPPRRLAEGEFSLLAGPERIESGWWDGAQARRDYFIARTGESSLAWIYRERGMEAGGHWFLHGFFA